MTEAEARTRLNVLCDVDQQPKLSSDEVDRLLVDALRGTNWVAATPVVYGAVIRPLTRNGHRYRCIRAGTSGASEPAWPITVEGTVNDPDASGAQWQEIGPDWEDDQNYDLNWAAHTGWLLKAGKAASLFDFQSADQRFQRSQMTEHCEKMAKKYQRVFAV